MNKLVLLGTVLTFTAAFAAASPADLSIFPQSSSVRIDSFTSFEVELENTGPVMDEYSLSASDASAVSIAPRQVELEPGESEVVNVWYNPDTGKEAGRYSMAITATSQATGKKYSVDAAVEVIKEHKVDVEVMESSKTACLGEKKTYTVEVTNDGIQKEQFKLSSEVGEFTTRKMTLEDGETVTTKLIVSSNKPVQKTFNVVAASTKSYAQDIQAVEFNSETCYASEVVVNPGQKRAAAGTTAEFNVTVRNEGTKQDEFTLKTSRGELEKTTLEIPAKESKTTQLQIKPTEKGKINVEITAKSEVTSKDTATVQAYNGMDMNLSTNTVTTCENTTETTQITVKNTGKARETYTLKTDTGKLGTKEVTLRPGQKKQVGLTVDTAETGIGQVNYKVEVKASSFGKPVKTVEGQVNVENCYDLRMSIVPEVASAGENRSQIYEVRLENTGTKENTYKLAYEGPSWISIKDRESDEDQRTVTVQPGETGFADIYAGIPFQKKGEVKITATAVGKEIKKSETVKLVIGKDIKKAIKDDKGSITGRFTEKASNLADTLTASNTAGKAAIAIITGLILTAAILYREWK
ncbi:MAG: hypothetical protein ABEJ93_01070 [Candidatus Nanohalobium sp.]